MFQSETKYKIFVAKIEFYFHENENHFHVNGFALGLALKQKIGTTRKWPV